MFYLISLPPDLRLGLVLACLTLFGPWVGAQTHTTEGQLDQLLAKLDRGESIENLEVNLQDIHFKFNSAELESRSYPYLDKVVSFLTQVANIDLQLSGHTDNIGDPDYNRQLSEDRANSVLQYLQGKEIEASRLAAAGYGQAQPIASNETEAGRQLNRRVTFTVIKKAQVKTIQHLIVLRNGDTLGVKEVRITESAIYYRNYTSAAEQSLPRKEVEWVIFDDGRREYIAPVALSTTTTERTRSAPDLSIIWDLFDPSKAFVNSANLLWVDYQAVSTGGNRPYRTGGIVPPLGIHYERQLFHNLGVRASLASQWWREDRPLAQAGTETYNEDFVYQHWTAGLGVSWHFAVSEKWDPYLGYMFSYRRSTGACDCLTETNTLRSRDFYLGVRYLVTPGFFLLGEMGQNGVGTIRAGMGLDF